jgi:acyl dehydratase
VPRLHGDDVDPGRTTDSDPCVVARADVVVAESDPRPMHLGEQAAHATPLGGLVASGWHGCRILMRMAT